MPKPTPNWPYPWLNDSKGRRYLMLRSLIARMSSGLTVAPMYLDAINPPIESGRHELLTFLSHILDGFRLSGGDQVYVVYMPLKSKLTSKEATGINWDKWLSNSLQWVEYQLKFHHKSYKPTEHTANAFFVREIVVPLSRDTMSPQTAVHLDRLLESGALD